MNNLNIIEPNDNLVTMRLERDLAKFIKDKVGKGPDSIEVTITDDIAVCLFRGFMTKAEQMIAGSGHFEMVCVTRSIFVCECIPDVEEILRRVLNRKIRHIFSGFGTDKELACWTIYLD